MSIINTLYHNILRGNEIYVISIGILLILYNRSDFNIDDVTKVDRKYISYAPSSDIIFYDEMAKYQDNPEDFISDLYVLSNKLNIKPEWLMEVMMTESRFRCDAVNPSTGASGLIQFMPLTATELGIDVYKIRQSNYKYQFKYIEKYIRNVKFRYGNRITNAETMYLAVFYPKALLQKDNLNHVIFYKGSKSYKQNSGLDHNLDGKISIKDIYDHFRAKRDAYKK